MNKKIVMLCISMFVFVMYAGGNSTFPTIVNNSVDTAYSYEENSHESILLASEDQFIESVEAQNHGGTETRYFKIMAREVANGRYHFYAQDKNGTYDIQYAERNKYKPFYLYAYGVRWYFASKKLDSYSGTKTKQW